MSYAVFCYTLAKETKWLRAGLEQVSPSSNNAAFCCFKAVVMTGHTALSFNNGIFFLKHLEQQVFFISHQCQLRGATWASC